MKSIHRTSTSISSILALVLLISVPLSSAALAKGKHPSPAKKAGRTDKRQTSGRGSRAERRRAEARRHAEAARQAAAAHERAIEEAMRDRVQSMIAKDDVTGEDPDIRRIAVNALGNHAGTVVVMDPQTGRIYSIVNQQWALREGFKPCSTIKLVTGLAGLNEKVIDPADTAAISDSNRVDLTRALAYSKNDYFQQVGGQVGFTKMISYAHRLGLGERTGINLRNESAGRVPTFKSGFAVNHMSSHGDDFKVTAVQLATLVSAIANGGQLLTPFVPHTGQEESKLTPKVRRTVNIETASFQQMLPGMIGSVSYGSGRRAFDSQETVLGKTGTCIEQGTWVGLFTSYAPLKNPKLAVVVIARGADGRNHFPAAVAGRIYRDLNGRFGTTANMQIAASRDPNTEGARTQSTIPPAKVEEIADDDEESDDVDHDKATVATSTAPPAATPKTIWGDARMPADSKVKRTAMPIAQSKADTRKPTRITTKDAAKVNPQTMERSRRMTRIQN
jgi:membrane peptidoglycan carboxypeptidase